MSIRILSTQIELTTPWFDLVSKRITGTSQPYFALRMRDYVSVVAFTEGSELILIRQYRPAIERYTLELPSGQVEEGETPANSAHRELVEETGFSATELESVGTLLSDTGRHENRLWCFYAPRAILSGTGYAQELGLERLLVPRIGLRQLIINGEFDHALHMAALMMVILRYGSEIFGLK